MKTKKKIRVRIFAFLALSLVLVSVLGISTFAFQYNTLNEAGGIGGAYHDDLADIVFHDEYDILPMGGIILENMSGMIGAVPWEEYGPIHGYDYADYAYNIKQPIYAVEFLVVKCEVDQIMNNHVYDVISDGNFYFPGKDTAAYFENGLRVIMKDGNFRFSFLDNFVEKYAKSASDYRGLEKYQLYLVAYHYDITQGSPDTTVSKEKYEALNKKYKAEISARTTAEENLAKKSAELSDMAKQNDILNNEKIELESSNASLEQNIADLNVKLESTANAGAVTNFFDGIYQAVSGTLNTFFDLNIFGVSLGSIIAILLGALVVIVVLKLVL